MSNYAEVLYEKIKLLPKESKKRFKLECELIDLNKLWENAHWSHVYLPKPPEEV